MGNTEKSWRQRWLLVVAGGLIMGGALGIRHVQGLFMQPVILDRGWSREAFGFALALQNLVWGLAQPFTGMIADRFGSLRVLLAGALVYAAGLAWMALSPTLAGFTWGNGVLVGMGLSGTAFGVVYGALSRLFAPQQRAWALGMAGAIGGLGQFVMVPSTQALLGGLGWSTVALVLAGCMAGLAPLALCLRGEAQAPAAHEAQQSLAQAIREAFAHRGFWLLNLGFLACGFQLAFIGAHLPSYLLDQGLGAREAGACLAIIALANVAGTYLCSHAGELARRKHVLALLYLVRALAMAVFVWLPVSAASAYVFSFVMGLLWLGTAPLTNALVSQIFGVRYIATLFGFVFFGHQLGGFLGAWLGGVVFDATHSYQWLWFASVALGLLAAVLHWPIDDRPLLRRPLAAGMA